METDVGKSVSRCWRPARYYRRGPRAAVHLRLDLPFLPVWPARSVTEGGAMCATAGRRRCLSSSEVDVSISVTGARAKERMTFTGSGFPRFSFLYAQAWRYSVPTG